jgi:hypothetical protein
LVIKLFNAAKFVAVIFGPRSVGLVWRHYRVLDQALSRACGDGAQGPSLTFSSSRALQVIGFFGRPV